VVYLTHHLTRYRQKIGAWMNDFQPNHLLDSSRTPALAAFLDTCCNVISALMLYSLLILSLFFVGTSRLLEVASFTHFYDHDHRI
jgi:hypothetical protein